MSSGAYALEVPIVLVEVAVGTIVSGIETIRDINEARDRKISELDSVRERVDSFVREVTAEMSSVSKLIGDALSAQDTHEDQTSVVKLGGITALKRSEVHSGFDEDVLLFTELDVAKSQITYVAIDFSDVLSVFNARNSTEFIKMQISSLYTKRIMGLRVAEERRHDVENFIETMNQLLDDKSVGVETFESLLRERFSYLESLHTEPEELDAKIWQDYCALCAIRHEHPRPITDKAELQRVYKELMQEEVVSRYRRGAGIALLETMQELGLQMTDEVVLELLPGKQFSEPGNTDYALFVNTSEQGFLLEMTESETLGPDAAVHKASLCKKRRLLAERMLEKGYVLTVVSENETADVSHEKITVPQSRKTKETAADRIRKRRMIAGKKGKSRAIGGA